MATAKLDGVEITCDRLIKELIDRVIRAEKRADVLQKELDELRDDWAEHLPFLCPQGLRFRDVLVDGDESLDGKTVVVKSEYLDESEQE